MGATAMSSALEAAFLRAWRLYALDLERLLEHQQRERGQKGEIA